MKCHRPFSVVQRENFRKHVKHLFPFLLNNLKNYLSLFTRSAKRTLQLLYPIVDRKVLEFDGQTTPDPYYIEIFAAYTAENKDGFEMVYLALSSIEDGIIEAADEYINIFFYVLSNFDNSFENFLALIGDHCYMK